MKTCCQCNKEKPFTEFNKAKNRKDGHQTICRECQRAYRKANKETLSLLNKKWREENKEELRQKKKQYRIENKEAHNERNRKWAAENREQEKVRNRKYYQDNKEQILKRRMNEPTKRLKYNISRSVYKALKRATNTSKGGSTFEYLPYTPHQLKERIENQFEPWMTWDNWSEWHIDHIIPQSVLLYDSLEHPNFQKCWALDNLRPLKAEDNLKKSNKII